MMTLDDAQRAFDEASKAEADAREARLAALAAVRATNDKLHHVSGGDIAERLALELAIAEATVIDSDIAYHESIARREQAERDFDAALAGAHDDPEDAALASWENTLNDVTEHFAEIARLEAQMKAEHEAASRRITASHAATERITASRAETGGPRPRKLPGDARCPQLLVKGMAEWRSGNARAQTGTLQTLRVQSRKAWAAIEVAKQAAADREQAKRDAEKKQAKREKKQAEIRARKAKDFRKKRERAARELAEADAERQR
jgi:hypothetical protein